MLVIMLKAFITGSSTGIATPSTALPLNSQNFGMNDVDA